MILLIVDVVVSVLGVPLWVAHRVLLGHIGLRAPHLGGTVRVLWGGELSLALGDVHLIVSHQVMKTGVHLVLEPSVWHTQVVIGMDTDGQLTGNRIPGVLVHLPNRGITKGHLGHFIVDTCGPKHFDFLSLGVSYNLTANVGLISFIEDIDTHVDNDVSEINFFIGGQTQLLDSESFTTSKAGSTSEQLINISGLGHVIPRSSHLTVKFLDVFHGPGSIIGWNGAGLSNGVDVSHIVDWWWGVRVERLNVSVDVLSPVSG